MKREVRKCVRVCVCVCVFLCGRIACMLSSYGGWWKHMSKRNWVFNVSCSAYFLKQKVCVCVCVCVYACFCVKLLSHTLSFPLIFHWPTFNTHSTVYMPGPSTVCIPRCYAPGVSECSLPCTTKRQSTTSFILLIKKKQKQNTHTHTL